MEVGLVLKEFKAFVMRGNLLELAVAFILGVAFAAVVGAFTNIVLGFIAYIFGSSASFDAIGVHNDAGALVIPIGAFITACINFLIVAFVLFLVVKAYNRLQKPKEEAGPTEIDLLEQIVAELRK